jgi:hypothetical protein
MHAPGPRGRGPSLYSIGYSEERLRSVACSAVGTTAAPRVRVLNVGGAAYSRSGISDRLNEASLRDACTPDREDALTLDYR